MKNQEPITINLDVLNPEQPINDRVLYIPHAETIITGQCNLRCTYCFEDKENGKNVLLEDLKPYLEKRGTLKMNLFGGEPFVNPKFLEDYLGYIETMNASQWIKDSLMSGAREMITNGTLISKPSNLELIKKYGLRLQISLDGDRAEHDAKRIFNGKGAGSWDIIMKNLEEICNHHDIQFSFHGVVAKDNLQSLDKTIKFYFEKQSELMSFDRAIFSLNANLFQIIFEEDYDDSDIDLILTKIFETCNYFWNHPKLTLQQRKQAIKNLLTRQGGVCGAGHTYFAIDPNMDVYACHRLSDNAFSPKDEQKLGNIYDPVNIKNQRIFNTYFNIGQTQKFLYSFKFFNRGYEKDKYSGFWFNWCPATNIQQSGNPYFIPVKYTVMHLEISRLVEVLTNYFQLV